MDHRDPARAAVERWAQLFDAFPLPVATLAADGTVLEVNRAGKAWAAGPPARLPLRFHDFVPAHHHAALAAAIAQAASGQVSRLELLYHRGDGSLRRGEATIVPFDDPAGRAVAVGILRDTTQEAEAQQELIQMEKLATAGELLAGVTHELNNPLTAVLSLAELAAARTDLDPQLRDDLQQIRREAYRAVHIVRQLLAFVRHSDPLRLPLDLNELIHDTLALRRGTLQADGIQLELQLAELPRLAGDPYQLQQVLLNLFINAEHALLAVPAEQRRLLVTTQPAPGGVELVVRDTGPGIPTQVLPRVFDPFVTTKRAGQGTGLGLSILQRIVRNHGGRATAANHPDGGAVFTVFLPCAEAGPSPAGRDGGAPAAG